MESCSPQGQENHKPNKGSATDQKKNPYWKAVRIGSLFGIIEILALVFWVKSEDFAPDAARYARWAAICGFLAGGGFLAHKMTGGRFKKRIISGIWIAVAIVCVVLFLTIPEEPKPDFVISLRFGESQSEVFLTNDFLMERHMIDAGRLSNGAELMHSFVPGWIFIPVKQGESNKVFRIRAENMSSITISDLEIVAGFPLGWDCRVDPGKWGNGDFFLIFGKRAREIKLSQWMPTNMQYFVTKNPPTLFPLDSVELPPITNPCANEPFMDGIRGGHMDLMIRCTGYGQIMAANLAFAPETSNFSKPLIIYSKVEKDGSVRFLTNEEQFK